MTLPEFSIIVPTYNRAHLIDDTLKSLLQQDYKNYEIIIVDDGSTDDTESVVQKYLSSNVRYYKKNNAERAAARNYGAEKASGTFVNFFDSDDIALANHLAEASKMLQQYPDAAWFHLAYAWADPQHNVFREVNNYTGTTLNYMMHLGNPLSCNGVFVRKSVILDHPFNEDRNLSASEDYELWCRLAARYPLHYSNFISSWVIDHENRSVRTINGEKLIRRLELLIQYISADAKCREYYGKGLSIIKMDSYSYIALHLANSWRYKLKSFFYLLKAMKSSFYLLRTKRFYATLKNIIIKW